MIFNLCKGVKMADKKLQQQQNSTNVQLSKEKPKDQVGIYSLTNATTISLMMREANRSANINMKVIEKNLRQERNK